MTPALGLFYAGPRAREEHAQHVHDVHRRARRSRRSRGRSSATRSRSTRATGSSAASTTRSCRTSTFEPRDGQTIPHLLFMAFQATFCIITVALVSGAVVERMRFGAVPRVRGALVGAASTPCSPTGPSAAAGCIENGTLDFAGGVPVEMGSGLLGARGRARGRARARTTGARRSCRTTPSTCCSAPGLLWFGWFGFNGGSGFSTGQQRRARVHEHAALPGVHAGRLVHARPRSAAGR